MVNGLFAQKYKDFLQQPLVGSFGHISDFKRPSTPSTSAALTPNPHKPQDGREAGCIALCKISENICEMKRLFVRDEYRDLGIGKQLITAMIEEISKIGYHYVRLDTLPTMKKAQDLYMKFGFYDIEPYVYNPIKGTRFMELKLRA